MENAPDWGTRELRLSPVRGEHMTAMRGRQFDRLPIGLLLYRLNNLIYANRAFLDWTRYANLDALRDAGGLDSLFIETKNLPAPKETKTCNGRPTASG